MILLSALTQRTRRPKRFAVNPIWARMSKPLNPQITSLHLDRLSHRMPQTDAAYIGGPVLYTRSCCINTVYIIRPVERKKELVKSPQLLPWDKLYSGHIPHPTLVASAHCYETHKLHFLGQLSPVMDMRLGQAQCKEQQLLQLLISCGEEQSYHVLKLGWVKLISAYVPNEVEIDVFAVWLKRLFSLWSIYWLLGGTFVLHDSIHIAFTCVN